MSKRFKAGDKVVLVDTQNLHNLVLILVKENHLFEVEGVWKRKIVELKSISTGLTVKVSPEDIRHATLKEATMSKKLDKKLVDEVIRLTKKYYETGDTDYLGALRETEKVLEENTSWRNVALIEDLVKYTHKSGNGTYDDIYRALGAFGIIVEDNENE